MYLSTENKQFHDIVKETAVSLKRIVHEENENFEMLSLRKLKKHCSENIFTMDEKSFEFCTVYFLMAYLDDVANNFGGDAQYSKFFQIVKIEFYKKLSELLERLSIAIEKENIQFVFNFYQDATRLYVEKINKLNKIQFSL